MRKFIYILLIPMFLAAIYAAVILKRTENEINLLFVVGNSYFCRTDIVERWDKERKNKVINQYYMNEFIRKNKFSHLSSKVKLENLYTQIIIKHRFDERITNDYVIKIPCNFRKRGATIKTAI
jgi:hypothetical protein